jgi:hypothetical protein
MLRAADAAEAGGAKMSTTTISETVSKKPARGRPRKFSLESVRHWKSAFPEINTERGLQDLIYVARAQKLLRNNPAYKWIVDPIPATLGQRKAFKKTILSALGRIDDDDGLREAAKAICEVKPTTKRAVMMIRHWRGKESPGDAISLTNIIINVVGDYTDRHPETALQQIRGALANADDAFVEAQDTLTEGAAA